MGVGRYVGPRIAKPIYSGPVRAATFGAAGTGHQHRKTMVRGARAALAAAITLPSLVTAQGNVPMAASMLWRSLNVWRTPFPGTPGRSFT